MVLLLALDTELLVSNGLFEDFLRDEIGKRSAGCPPMVWTDDLVNVMPSGYKPRTKELTGGALVKPMSNSG